MTHSADKEYDVMRDVVVRAGIRDRMIADLKSAIDALANWQARGAEFAGYEPTIDGAEEYARMARDRCDRDWKKL